MIYCLYTLVDITETRQHHGGNLIEKNQQQNFESVIQTIGLVGNIDQYKSPVVVPASMFNQKNKHAWKFEWSMEHEEVFSIDGDPIGKLKEIFEYVPIILNLTEDSKIDKPMFQSVS